MRALHLVASHYAQRPSRIVRIRDPVAAYQFDISVLMRALDPEDSAPAKYQDVRQLARGEIPKVRIPEDGIW